MTHEAGSENPRVNYELRRKKNAEEMKHQVTSFVMMIFLTLIAFATVYAGFSKWFTIPFILLLGVVQVIFQLYYFMHMNQRGHEAVMLFLFSGAFIGFVTILAYVTIIWW